MTSQALSQSTQTGSHEAAAWRQRLARYRDPSHTRSVAELVITVAPLVALWIAAWAALDVGYWLSAVFVILGSGFCIRLFIFQHDCSHDSLFRRRAANTWVGRVISMVTITPFSHWRRLHSHHHAVAGNLGKRGIGDIATLTVEEYRRRGRFGRFTYRVTRNPFLFLTVGPFYLFFIQNRWPYGFARDGWEPWASTMITNLALAILFTGLIWLVGLGPFLLVHLAMVYVAAVGGAWLIYVQHQYEDTHWRSPDRWSHSEAALHGSSFYDLPKPLAWITGNIGIHHVHHLNSRIPFYRLPEVLRDHPEFLHLNRLTLLGSLRCLRLALWDEHSGRLISFREARRQQAAALLRPADQAAV